ncbi:hypothetical protein F5Y03DRAFT_314772 [Xylaria venustula]|nr:hypothetical protein F5Y03DRAFT_314772 [Xylaria venustula]
MSRFQGRYREVQDQSLDTYEARYEGEGFGYHSQYHYAPNPTNFRHDHEDKHVPKSPERQYKPTALRWPFLLTLLLALLATLGTLSYALKSLPAVGSQNTSGRVNSRSLYQPFGLVDDHNPEHKARRTDAATSESASLTSESDTSTSPQTTQSTIETTTPVSSHVSLTSEGAKGPDDFGNIGTKTVTVSDSITPTPTPAQTKGSGNYGDIGTKTITESGPSITTSAGGFEDPSNDTETPTIASSRPESDYGNIGTKTVTESGSSTTVQAGDTTDGTEIPTFFPTPSQNDYGNIGTKTVSEAVSYTTTITSVTTSTAGETGGKPPSEFGEVGSRTVSEQPHASSIIQTQVETVTHITLGATTITDTNGSPVTTSTRAVPSFSSLQTSTLTDSTGHVTATQVVTVVATPSTTVKTDSAGNPTATILTYPIVPDSSAHTSVYSIDGGHYFMGTFLPTLIASIIGIAVRILETNALSFQPWHALTHERGASGRDSLCLQTGGWRSWAMGLRSLLGGQAVVFLASLLSLSSALLVPVSAGAITLDLRGDGCKYGGSSASNCAYVLSVAPTVSKATIGILAAMSLTTIFLIVMIARWRLGVYSNPWSMCTLASLSAHPDVRRLVLDAAHSKQARTQLKNQDFKLDYFRGAKGQLEYGIVALDRFRGTGLSSIYEKVPLTGNNEDNDVSGRRHGPPFFMLGIIGRLCSLFLLSGVLVLVLYYANTGGDTAFENFIDSDSFGVQFLFTGLGVLISLFWFSFFGAVAVMNSYQVLAESPREAGQSILLAPPTNAFSGLWHAVRTRRVFFGVVSLASILSESLGIFLGNVRFQVTQTLFIFQLCTWTAVGIMSFMVLILLASFFIKWPDMPVEPSTIAGALYYVCDTSVVDRFEGLSTLDKKERDRAVTNMALLYEFNERMTAAGGSSIGLKVLDTKIFMS